MESAPAIDRALRACALALATWCAAAPAQAEVYNAHSTPFLMSTSSSILGGAPSRLAQVSAQQHGFAVREAVEPSAFNIPARNSRVVAASKSNMAAPWTGKPDLFGSVAVRVNRTSLDDRWQRVSRAALSGRAYSNARALSRLDAGKRIGAVNKYVNSRITFVDDWREHGRADIWSAASDTLKRRRGDCEDYAVAKLQMLRAAGIPTEDLYLVLVRDLVRNSDHAVLVVRAEGQTMLLDNGTDEILDPDNVSDYRPIFTFASSGSWTHGYRRQPAPQIEWASKQAPATDAPVELAPAQRSRSASLRAFMTGFNK